MSFWSRLFSRALRRAAEAEAAGEVERAAELYLEAGEPLRAAELRLTAAQACTDRWERARGLRDALDVLPEIGAPHAEWVVGYADLVEALVATSPALDREGKALLADAATKVQAMGDPERAGQLYAQAGWREHAADAYAEAGKVFELELTAAAAGDERERETVEERAVEGYEEALAGGDLLTAHRTLQRALERQPENPRLVRLQQELVGRFPARQTVVMLGQRGERVQLIAQPELVVGRAKDADWTVLAPGVSRRHARLERTGGGVQVHALCDGVLTIDGTPAPASLAAEGEMVLGGLTVPYRVETTAVLFEGQGVRVVWGPAWQAGLDFAGLHFEVIEGWWHVHPYSSREGHDDDGSICVDGMRLMLPRLLTRGACLVWPGGQLEVA